MSIKRICSLLHQKIQHRQKQKQCINVKLIELFVFTLQVQFQGLFQMILVLGIGGSFPYGFHISVINYPSVVSSCLPEAEIPKRRA